MPQTIRVISATAITSLEITDMNGRVQIKATAPGDYRVNAPGVYLVKIQGNEFSEVKKIIVR